jgi:hypothetical protein
MMMKKMVMMMMCSRQELVRIAFAECLASLAETSKRFLDISYATKPQVRY